MRLGHAGEKALQGLVKQGLLKGAKTGKHGFCEHCVLGKQTRVKFGTAVHNTKGFLIMFTQTYGDLQRMNLLEVIVGLLLLLMISQDEYGCT